jgi:alkylated DNA repair dioxygenase AlkB
MQTEACGDLFGISLPDGLRYAPEVFSEAEQGRFIRAFEALPFQPFQFFGHLGKRRVVSFGFRYDYGEQALLAAEPMPDFVREMRQIASRFSKLPADALQQALVTEYAPGAGIGWHRDRPMFQDVVALSFLSPGVLRLRRRDGKKWRRHALQVAPRSGDLLQGEAREVWEHSIPPMTALRYSVTFRSFRERRI